MRGSHAAGFTSKARVDGAPREVTDAASLVEPLPGVHVRRYGADDTFSTLSVRGSSSTQVAMYLAGVPLTGGADPTLDLASLPLWPGVRARVYRSFAPATMGPGSLGGTLALDAPALAGPDMTEVWLGAGAFGARRMRAADVRALGDRGARVVTALSASRADDDFSYWDPGVPPSGAFATRENAGHAQVSALVGWSVPVHLARGETGRLTVTALAQARRQRVPGPLDFPTPNQRLDSERELGAIELTAPDGRGAWITRAWARRDGLALSDAPTALQPVNAIAHTADAIVAAGGAAGWRGRPHRAVTLDARLDASGERFAPGTRVGGDTPPHGATRASGGAAADLEWRATGALTATASARLDAWHDAPDEGLARSELRPTGHVGAEWTAGPVAIATHGGALTRPPSFVELYGDRGAFAGDPNLLPESAWTVDLGARAATRAGPLRVRAELVGFGTWAEDLIAFVQRGFGTFQAVNIGRARIAGVESELEMRAFGAGLRASYTYLATENESDGACTGSPCGRPPLPGRPAHDLVADVTYDVGPARLRYGIDVVSGISIGGQQGGYDVPARALHSVGARLDVPDVPGLRLAVDVRNLFDLRTAPYAGTGYLGPTTLPIGDLYDYPLPGRSALFTARWLFDATPGAP